MICKSQRMDLGECPQIHDLALRADYEAAQKKKDHFYDIDVSICLIIIYNILYHGTMVKLLYRDPSNALIDPYNKLVVPV